MWRKTGPVLILTLVLAVAIPFSGCAGDQQRELPAIKVEFSHYDINQTHILEIKKANDVYINRSEAPKLYEEPPFPGIHIFAYNGLNRTPITYVPLEKEGDNLTTYIGFENPDKVPQKGDKILVYMDVVNRQGDILKSHSRQITWDLETESPILE